MEWLCNVGYTCFPWVAGADSSHFQNRMHLAVTVLVVVFSLAGLSFRRQCWGCICFWVNSMKKETEFNQSLSPSSKG